MPPVSLQKQTNFLVQRWQTEEYSPGWVTDFVRMRDLVLPWQQMHERAGTCKQNCPQCEPRRGKFVTWTPRLWSFWGRRIQSCGIFSEFRGGGKSCRRSATSRIQQRWRPHRRETHKRAQSRRCHQSVQLAGRRQNNQQHLRWNPPFLCSSIGPRPRKEGNPEPFPAFVTDVSRLNRSGSS